MSGVGPVEPGEGTLVREAPPRLPRGRLALCHERHRRTVLASASVLVALAGGGYLYASRPQPRPAPPPPYPSQAIDLVYLAPVTGPPGAAADAFSFTVLLSVRSGPPVTVTRLTQLRRPVGDLLPRGTFPDKITFRPQDHCHDPGDGM